MMKTSISPRKLREFGLLIGIGFPIIIGWFLPVIGGEHFRIWTLYIGVPALILGILRPNSLIYPYKKWILIGHILGWINSRIILGLVFIAVLQPIAIVMKIFFGYDPLKKRKEDKSTYREIRSTEKIDLTRIF